MLVSILTKKALPREVASKPYSSKIRLLLIKPNSKLFINSNKIIRHSS